MSMLLKLKYFFNKFDFLRVYFSPFITPKIGFYFGKIQYGTPYFFPRKWVNNPDKPGYKKAIPKKLGFDIVALGWKTKWSDIDYRFEWGPMISFVCFNKQFCIFWKVPEPSSYWEAWLYYSRNSDKKMNVKERVKETITKLPQKFIINGPPNYEHKKVNYYYNILKRKYHKYIN